MFEVFLPQLLRYPNPADPLNGEAAALLMRDPKAYAKKVESYVEKYASETDADRAGDSGDGDEPMQRSNRGQPSGNGHSSAAGNGSSSNGASGNGHSKNGTDADGDVDVDSDDDDDKMSDMGELSDDDEFMGEMDD